MFVSNRALVILCLVTVESVAMTINAKSVTINTPCQYRKKDLNSVSSKLIPNGHTSEIEGKLYHCNNGTMSERLEKTDIITLKFGETSSLEHHIRKRFLWIVAAAVGIAIGIGIGVCIAYCVDEEKASHGHSQANNPPQLTCPESGRTVYVNRSEVKVVHSWTDPTATDPDGEDTLNSIELTSGHKSGSYFERGSHVVSYKVSDSKGAEDTCSFTFTVKVISCLPIQPPDNSRVTCEDEFIYGSSCTVNCNEGYEMIPATNNNEQVISCEKSGTSGVPSESPNSCKAIVCPAALNPANGKAVCSSSNHTFQTVCSTNCDSGYTVLHNQQTECQSDRQWSHVLPACTDSEKPIVNTCPEDIYVYAERNGQPTIVFWSLPSATDNSGIVSVTRIEGQAQGSSFPEGHHKLVYTASDANGNISPNCTFYVHVAVLICSPPVINDRFLTFDCPDGYGYGSSCRLSCMGSFPLVGNDVITCERNNDSMATYWDVGSETFYCKTNPCNPLPAPSNGAISCASWVYGQMCTMQCQENFDIPYGTKSSDGVSNFNGHFTCSESDGKYHPSNTVPNCTEIRNVRFSALPSEFFYYAGDCTDEETLKQIKENFISLMIQRQQSGWAGACPNTTECNVNNTEVICGPTSGRRRRSADDTDIDLDSVTNNVHKRSLNEIKVKFFVITTWQNLNPSIETFLHMETIQQNIFGVIKESAENGALNVSGLSPEMSSFSYSWSDPGCPDGMTVRWTTMTCVPCAIGTYLDKSNPLDPKCRNCPRGTYKDREEDALCTTCPSGMSTLDDGAESITECIEKCSKGEFSDNGLKPCNVCPKSRYQSEEMSTSCEECPLGKSSNPGSISVNNCSEFDIIFSKHGDTILFDNNHINETNKFAVFAWINHANCSLTIIDGKLSSWPLNITYGKTVCVELSGYKTTLNITSEIHDWHHVAIVVNGDSTTISVYINGKLDVWQSVPTLANVSLAGTFAVTLNEDSPTDIFITGYQVYQNIPSEDEIVRQSSSCHYTRNDTVLSMGNIKWTNSHTPRTIVPSQCDNIDHCSPNPCNGHECTDRVRRYTCHCTKGYSGEHCEISTDYCRDTLCKNGGSCQNRNNTYTCLCSQMYKGKNCEIPIVNGGWSVWTEFSDCSMSCNGGLRTRSRVCNNPSPDPDGLPCDSSQSTQSVPCNTETCPTCPELELSFGNVKNCSDVSGDTVCEVFCQPGYTFAPDNLPLKEYRCGQSTGYTWNGQTPACGRAKMPSSLSTVSFIQYNQPIQCDKTSTALSIVQGKLEANLSCYQLAICTVTTKMGDCQSSVSSIKVTLTATLPEKDLDLETYYTSGKLSESLQTLVTTVEELENSTLKLNGTAHILEFDIDVDTFSPTETRVTGIVDCDEGQGSDVFICLDCPMGTYSTSWKCKLCEKGTYQDEIGQITCKPCPTGLTSKFLGSQDASSCSVSSDVTSSTHNVSKQITESGKSDLIVVVAATVVVVTVVIFIGVISVLFYKAKCVKEQILFTRGKSSISIGSLLSLRKISPELDTSKANEYNNVPPKSQILSVKDLCE